MAPTPKHPSHGNRPKVRLYHPDRLSAGQLVTLPADQAHYLGRVLRLSCGSEIGLFNGESGEWRAVIAQLDRQTATLRLADRVRAPQPCPPLTLAIATIRKERLEWLVEKAAELGVTAIELIETRYCNAPAARLDRLQRIAAEAAEQCERMDLPTVVAPQAFDAWLALAQQRGPVIAPIERLDAQPIHRLDPAHLTHPTLVIGPEGGFAPEEQQAMLAARPALRPVTLGQRLLRAETAALAGLTLIQSLRGALDLPPGTEDPS